MCDLYQQNISTAIENRYFVKKIMSYEFFVLLKTVSISISVRHSSTSNCFPKLFFNLI